MLDVIHFMFEEDSKFSTAEEAESVSAMRTSLYSQMYKTSYRYAIKTSRKTSNSNSFNYEDDEIKPYIPPTEFNPESHSPFGDLLDAPIG